MIDEPEDSSEIVTQHSLFRKTGIQQHHQERISKGSAADELMTLNCGIVDINFFILGSLS